jgi:hypothetical protein
MLALRRDLPTVVGHCLHDTTLGTDCPLMLPEAGRIIVSAPTRRDNAARGAVTDRPAKDRR